MTNYWFAVVVTVAMLVLIIVLLIRHRTMIKQMHVVLVLVFLALGCGFLLALISTVLVMNDLRHPYLLREDFSMSIVPGRGMDGVNVAAVKDSSGAVHLVVRHYASKKVIPARVR